jgi:hypothetical protein
MTQAASAANARLQPSHPGGFSLDATHRPHVTLIQRYVRTAELDRAWSAVAKALEGEDPSTWKLRAVRWGFTPWGGPDLVSFVVEPTEDLLRVQKKLVDALAPFTAASGTAAAFHTTAREPGIEQAIIDYVAVFVPQGTGERFNPHVTLGLASADWKTKMAGAKFEPFTFSPAGVAGYQLGHYGTARKKLKAW